MGDGSNPNSEKHEKNETTRVMLQIYHERGNHLANMLIALNGFMVAFIAGLLTFVGSSALFSPKCVNISGQILVEPSSCINPWPIFIAINIAIIVLIIWRFYSHYIDDDIVKGYRKLIYLEHDLEVSRKVSLLSNLEKDDGSPGLARLKIYAEIESSGQCDDQKFERKMKIIDELIKKKKMGYRGHFWFNFLTVSLITALLLIEVWFISITKTILDSNQLFYFGLFGLALIIILSFYCGMKRRLSFLSIDNKIRLKNCLFTIFIVVCLLLTIVSFVYPKFTDSFRFDIISSFFVIKNIVFFIMVGILIYCYIHKDPLDEDITQVKVETNK